MILVLIIRAKSAIPDAVVLNENDKVVGALDDFDIISKELHLM